MLFLLFSISCHSTPFIFIFAVQLPLSVEFLLYNFCFVFDWTWNERRIIITCGNVWSEEGTKNEWHSLLTISETRDYLWQGCAFNASPRPRVVLKYKCWYINLWNAPHRVYVMPRRRRRRKRLIVGRDQRTRQKNPSRAGSRRILKSSTEEHWRVFFLGRGSEVDFKLPIVVPSRFLFRTLPSSVIPSLLLRHPQNTIQRFFRHPPQWNTIASFLHRLLSNPLHFWELKGEFESFSMSIVNKDSYLTLLLVALWPYVTVVLCECGKINRLLVGRMAKGPNTRAALTIYSHFCCPFVPGMKKWWREEIKCKWQYIQKKRNSHFIKRYPPSKLSIIILEISQKKKSRTPSSSWAWVHEGWWRDSWMSGRWIGKSNVACETSQVLGQYVLSTEATLLVFLLHILPLLLLLFAQLDGFKWPLVKTFFPHLPLNSCVRAGSYFSPGLIYLYLLVHLSRGRKLAQGWLNGKENNATHSRGTSTSALVHSDWFWEHTSREWNNPNKCGWIRIEWHVVVLTADETGSGMCEISSD